MLTGGSLFPIFPLAGGYSRAGLTVLLNAGQIFEVVPLCLG